MTAEYSWIAPRKRSWMSQIKSAVCFIPLAAMVVDVCERTNRVEDGF